MAHTRQFNCLAIDASNIVGVMLNSGLAVKVERRILCEPDQGLCLDGESVSHIVLKVSDAGSYVILHIERGHYPDHGLNPDHASVTILIVASIWTSATEARSLKLADLISKRLLDEWSPDIQTWP